MTKIRCGDSIGIDLDQVVAWKKVKLLNSAEGNEALSLYFVGVPDGISVSRSTVGYQTFARLTNLLVDRFAIDLAGENSLKKTIDDYAGEAVLDRYIDPEELKYDC